MRRRDVVSLFIILLGLPALASGQDAKSILEKAQAKQMERWSGVDVYLVEQTTIGNATQTYFQRTDITDKRGNSQTLFLPVPSSRLINGSCVGAQSMNADQLETFASATEMTGGVLASEIEGGLEQAGLPPGLLAASGSDPTATFDPRVLMGANAEFLRGAAAAKREAAAADPGADASEAADQMAHFIETAKVVGKEAVDGRQAYHLRADGLGEVQEVDGGQYEMKTMNLWIDASEYVPLQMKMDGTLTTDGEVKPMTIENQLADYRKVPGSNMYEPFKQVMKISGMMDEEQQAQMKEAAARMAELEQQMANMPASQRQMMESMMGPQLEMMRGMASSGAFQTEIITNSIVVNPDMPGSGGQACPQGKLPGVSQAGQPATVTPDKLLYMIQSDLKRLGYNPGNTKGIMDKPTAVAISQFQASKGMEVTGQPSPQLAGALQAATDGRSSGGGSKDQLSADYLKGFWCTERTQEQELYKFAADGSYRLGVNGMTITQMDGINFFKETFSRKSFFDKFEGVAAKENNRFSMMRKGGTQETFLRGNCFE